MKVTQLFIKETLLVTTKVKHENVIIIIILLMNILISEFFLWGDGTFFMGYGMLTKSKPSHAK